MKPHEKISSYQFLILVTLFSIGTSILIIPSVLAIEAKQDAWIVAILGTLIGLLVIWLFCLLTEPFPNLTFVEINEKILGKWLGKAVSMIFVLMSLIYSASLLYYSGIFLNTNLMPNTPTIALNALMILIIVMGVRLGLETIARSAEFFILFFFVLFFFLLLFIFPNVKLENIQPIFEARPKTIIQSTMPFIEVTSVNAVVLLMVFPAFINNVKQAKKSFYIGYLIGGTTIIVFTFLSIAVLGTYGTATELFPSYELAKKVNVADFIQRIEALMATLWIIALYFKSTIYFYVSVLGISQIVHAKDYRPFAIPLGIIALLLSIVMFPNIIYQQKWNATVGSVLSYSIGVFLPILLIIVYTIRKKWRKFHE